MKAARNRKTQAGMSLVETMIALSLLLIVSAGVMGIAGTALSTTENQGHLAARTAEYAQDKMEELLALRFLDQCTDTTVYPAATNCGAATATGLSVGGSADPNAPLAGYVDYVDGSGNPVAASTTWQYIRVWQITYANAAQTLKQISVVCKVRNGVGQGMVPQTTVVALKSSPF